MPKYARCRNCQNKPQLYLEKGYRSKRKDGPGWTLACPICGSVSPERGTTKAKTIAAWNEANAIE